MNRHVFFIERERERKTNRNYFCSIRRPISRRNHFTFPKLPGVCPIPSFILPLPCYQMRVTSMRACVSAYACVRVSVRSPRYRLAKNYIFYTLYILRWRQSNMSHKRPRGLKLRTHACVCASMRAGVCPNIKFWVRIGINVQRLFFWGILQYVQLYIYIGFPRWALFLPVKTLTPGHSVIEMRANSNSEKHLYWNPFFWFVVDYSLLKLIIILTPNGR